MAFLPQVLFIGGYPVAHAENNIDALYRYAFDKLGGNLVVYDEYGVHDGEIPCRYEEFVDFFYEYGGITESSCAWTDVDTGEFVDIFIVDAFCTYELAHGDDRYGVTGSELYARLQAYCEENGVPYEEL